MPDLLPLPERIGPSRWGLPDPALIEGDVVGLGADLEPETLVDAYRRGIFPWPHEGATLPWFSPDPRAVIPAGQVRITASLAKSLRRSTWETTVDVAFAQVVEACSEDRGDGTWIVPEMRAAYGRLNRMGWAHSVEMWDGDTLVGGLYGVQVGAVFTGESMFHRATDASKMALVDLSDRMAGAGGRLIDCQLPTPHLESMGAVPMARSRFLAELATLRDKSVRLPAARLSVARLAPRSL